MADVSKAVGITGELKKKSRLNKTSTPPSSIDFDNIPPYPTVSNESSNKNNLAVGTSNSNFRLTSKKDAENDDSGNLNASTNLKGHRSTRSPLPARSSKLKQVPIPKIPEESTPKNTPQTNDVKQETTPPGPSQGDKMANAAMGLIRGASLTNFFKKTDAQASATQQQQCRRLKIHSQKYSGCEIKI